MSYADQSKKEIGFATKYSIAQMHTPNKKGKRKLDQITLGVIHYTGSSSMEGTLSWFKNSNSKVSAHYVIDEDGSIVQFGDREDILWHAGKSEWQGRKWCNKFSLGYEIVCGPKGQFTKNQCSALAELLRRDIQDTAMTAVVGHEHISPGRKVDPGKCLNWDDLPLALIDPESQLEFLSNQKIERESIIEKLLREDQKLAADKNIPVEDAKVINEINRATAMGDGRGATDYGWLLRIFSAVFKR